MTATSVQARIEEIGIIPAVRASSAAEAHFAAHAVLRGGIGVIEMTMTTPGAFNLIVELKRTAPELVVGAGTVLDLEIARRCLDAGAAFLTSPGLDPEILEFACRENVLVIPGALTPTEITAASKAGARLIKIFPCAQMGGPPYIKALKGPFPHLSLIAAGGVNQHTAMEFIRAGATALGVGEHLVPPEAVSRRNADWIRELCGRYLAAIRDARALIQPA